MPIAANVSVLLKERYSDIERLAWTTTKEVSPLFALCKTESLKEPFGKQYVVPVIYSHGAAASADAAIADGIAGDGADGGQPGAVAWNITPVTYDGTFKFTREELLRFDGMAPVQQYNLVKERTDAIVQLITNRLSRHVCDDGWGAIAQLTAAATSTTVTINAKVAQRITVGDRLQASLTKDNDVLLGSGAQIRVTGVNYSTGVITLASDPTSVWSGINSTSWIFHSGDHANGNSDPNQDATLKRLVTGIKAVVDQSSTTLWGVTRTGNPELTGHTVDCSSITDTRQALVELAERAFYARRKMDLMLVSGVSWKLLMLDIDLQKQVSMTPLGKYEIGFKSLSLPTSFGDVTIVPESMLEPGDAFGGPFNDDEVGPKLMYQGPKLINLFDFDGLDYQRVTTSGAREFMGINYFAGQFVLKGPGRYIRGTGLPTS